MVTLRAGHPQGRDTQRDGDRVTRTAAEASNPALGIEASSPVRIDSRRCETRMTTAGRHGLASAGARDRTRSWQLVCVRAEVIYASSQFWPGHRCATSRSCFVVSTQ